MTPPTRLAYDWAVLRLVPHPWSGTFVPVGVVLHARTAGFLQSKLLTDPAELRRRAPSVDVDLLVKYLQSVQSLVAGDPVAGPVALAPTSERFHWLTAPRSDVLQSSPVRTGVCSDPRAALDELYADLVAAR